MERLMPRRGEEKGSALIMAIIAMLVLGVFMLSFAVLANLEVRLGINQKEAQQALILAEAGMEHGKNMLGAAAGAGSFDSVIATSATRQLGVPAGGIAVGAGKYWVRADNDCSGTRDNGELAGGSALTPPLVPAAVEDSRCSTAPPTTADDENETVVLTAWAETANGRGRARVRAHYTVGNPWKHSCYDADGGLCIDDAAGGCNNNPCVDPSDPRHPNGPAQGPLPLPNDIRCGTAGSGSFPPIPAAHIPADVLGSMSATAPCVMYPYYQWALFSAGPTRERCFTVQTGGSGYGANNCGAGNGTLAYDPAIPICSIAATASKCHGLVFFGPGNTTATLATGADIQIGASGNPDIKCVGTQNDDSGRSCYNAAAPDSSLVVYSMGKVTITNNVEVQGTVVLHGNGVAGTGSNKDFGLTGTNRINTRPCVAGSPAPAPGCGYPLALLAYNPNEPPPITAGQTIHLDISNSTSFIAGLIYTGGTADFSPLATDGGIIAWDVNVTNTATRIKYSSTYGNAAPPPGFGTPPGGNVASMIPSTWVHCTSYGTSAAVLTNGPTACQ